MARRIKLPMIKHGRNTLAKLLGNFNIKYLVVSKNCTTFAVEILKQQDF